MEQFVVMVVDDDKFMHRLYENVTLADLEGFEGALVFRHAMDGADGLAMLRREGMPDVMVVDYRMEMDGVEFVRSAWAMGYRGFSLLVTSEKPEVFHDVFLARFGAAYLQKPPHGTQTERDQFRTLFRGKVRGALVLAKNMRRRTAG